MKYKQISIFSLLFCSLLVVISAHSTSFLCDSLNAALGKISQTSLIFAKPLKDFIYGCIFLRRERRGEDGGGVLQGMKGKSPYFPSQVFSV